MTQTVKKRSITLRELCEIAGGKISGDADVVLSGVAAVSQAVKGELTFLSGVKNYASHLEALKKSSAAAVIAPEEAQDLPMPALRIKNPYWALVKALEFFYPEDRPEYNIHPTAFVSEDSVVSKNAVIGPMAVIESGACIEKGAFIGAQAFVGRSAKIGAGSVIHPGARILKNCVVGTGCIIHSNTVVGSDGFGFTQHEGRQIKVPQVGNVVIEDDVEIGACVTIDRATMGSTVIGAGTKIDNMVHIAHNCQIGRQCVIVAQVGISGSTVLEDQVTLAGQVGTVGHVRVGRGTTVAARGVVTGDVEPGSFVSGFPIKPHAEERKILASLRKLPDLIKKVRDLEKKLEEK